MTAGCTSREMSNAQMPMAQRAGAVGKHRGASTLSIGRLSLRFSAILPISWSTVPVSYSQDLNRRLFLSIDDSVRKSLENESSSSVQVIGPSLRPTGDIFERFVNRSEESDACFGVLLAVPVIRRLEVLPRLRMKAVWLTYRHRTAGPSGGDALPHKG
jgi:hypothetical protein